MIFTFFLFLCLSNTVFGESDAAIFKRLRESYENTIAQLKEKVTELEEKVQVHADNELCNFSCARVCVGKDSSCYNNCYDNCSNNRNPHNKVNGAGSVLGSFLRRDAVHHVGVTVSNMTKSLAWYTEVLGGVEVIDAGGDGWLGDDVFQLLMQKEQLDAKERGESFDQENIAMLQNNGTDLLGARYITFGALQIELLNYRARDGLEQDSELPHFHHSSAPSQVNNMHISLYLHDDVDLDKFVFLYENESLKRGFTDVKCNRVIPVSSEEERRKLGSQLKYNSYTVEDGAFEGWKLAYCKGPDGEQIELNQALGRSKELFDDALAKYIARN